MPHLAAKKNVTEQTRPQYIRGVKGSELDRTPADEPLDRPADPVAELSFALHDVSNALTVVLGWLDVARTQARSSAATPQLLDAIEIALTHARLGHLLARRAIGAEAPQLPSAAEAPVALLRQAVLAVKPAADARLVSIEELAQVPLPGRLAQPATVLQILTNLLLNAVELSPPRSSVEIALAPVGPEMSFRVTDSGPGIDSERAERLFTSTDSTRQGGAGIGLRHCYALAEAHGGTLRLLEGQPHARFELRWRLAEGGEAAPEAVGRRDLGGSRVLVVEDDAAVAELLELALGARGVFVTVAADRRALSELTEGARVFDAALVDLSPISEDVPGALAALRRGNPRIPVLVISGSAHAYPCELAAEVSAWLRKPFEMSEVIRVLSEVLGR